jgi:hypothetical protein
VWLCAGGRSRGTSAQVAGWWDELGEGAIGDGERGSVRPRPNPLPISSSISALLPVPPYSTTGSSVSTSPSYRLVVPVVLTLAPPPSVSPFALPAEVLARIAAFTVDTPTFDFLQPEWVNTGNIGTVHSLCLVSRAFNRAATPVLYAELVVSNNQAAKALIATIGSARWRKAGLTHTVGGTVKAIRFGKPVDHGQEVFDGFVGEVLDAVRPTKLERVAVVGIELRDCTLAKLQSKLASLVRL